MQGFWLPLALYGLLTLSTIGFQCVSMDELVEIGIAKKSYLEILHEANSFPPLFHLLIAPLVAVSAPCNAPACGPIAAAASAPLIRRRRVCLRGSVFMAGEV